MGLLKHPLSADTIRQRGSQLSGTSAESISRSLGAGTYFVRVFPFSGANTSYNLSLAA
jgi:hypothetical protein